VVLLLMEGIFVDTDVAKAGDDFMTGEDFGAREGVVEIEGELYERALEEVEPPTFAAFHFRVGVRDGLGVCGVKLGGRFNSAREPIDFDLRKFGSGARDLSSGVIPAAICKVLLLDLEKDPLPLLGGACGLEVG